ncbi:sensor histidine kinase [Saccharospirillum salsuginis]|uniref:Alginate O-acetyltransferase n=1 Tax=Saccharospirillum salsuginis TaxID=418750 RepID=A0A918N7N0_9GAMM|nr:histidine kinase [Saccharospirillum salsuginis]GGX44703.1 alginate O-acetyltransferase [Saccharospirillum salsuginis]
MTKTKRKPTRAKPPRNQSLILPDLCATTSVFFLVLVSELLVLVWVLLQSGIDWIQLGYMSLTVQWIVLPSAAILCRLRHWLARRPLWQGWLVAFAAVSTVGFVVSLAGDWIVKGSWQDTDGWQVLRQTAATAIIAALLLRYFQLQQQVVDRSRAEMAARVEALQNRIRPHFLFNSLNTIAELIATRPVEAERAIEDLSRLFRASLREAGTFWSLEEELALVQGYLSLEQWRLGDRLRVVWRTPKPTLRWSVPVLILQPLIENAIVHGIAPQVQGGTLMIGCYQRGERLIIDIENPLPDNSPTAQEGRESRGNQVALNNIRHRLATLYGDGSKLYAAPEERSYRVRLTLPARLYNPREESNESLGRRR